MYFESKMSKAYVHAMSLTFLRHIFGRERHWNAINQKVHFEMSSFTPQIADFANVARQQLFPKRSRLYQDTWSK